MPSGSNISRPVDHTRSLPIHAFRLRVAGQLGGPTGIAAMAPLADSLDIVIPTIRSLQFLEQWCGMAHGGGEGGRAAGGADPCVSTAAGGPSSSPTT
jgi:hypothetical protein